MTAQFTNHVLSFLTLATNLRDRQSISQLGKSPLEKGLSNVTAEWVHKLALEHRSFWEPDQWGWRGYHRV